ncbi:YlxR family protein [Timonella senegalensis]|uniref:YlxR family protein n=1 Tax=Timonella senegalensis TaxID=1465825 RepID=UPI0009DA9AF1|nr:YlxR family protein [Timonella senegalensis]
MRTCIGCRAVAPSRQLVRVVLDSNFNSAAGEHASSARTARVDRNGGLPGRGSWLHPQQSCLDVAVKRRAFSRALRTHGEVDLHDVREYVAQNAARS